MLEDQKSRGRERYNESDDDRTQYFTYSTLRSPIVAIRNCLDLQLMQPVFRPDARQPMMLISPLYPRLILLTLKLTPAPLGSPLKVDFKSTDRHLTRWRHASREKRQSSRKGIRLLQYFIKDVKDFLRCRSNFAEPKPPT